MSTYTASLNAHRCRHDLAVGLSYHVSLAMPCVALPSGSKLKKINQGFKWKPELVWLVLGALLECQSSSSSLQLSLSHPPLPPRRRRPPLPLPPLSPADGGGGGLAVVCLVALRKDVEDSS